MFPGWKGGEIFQAKLPEFKLVSKEGNLPPDKNTSEESIGAFKGPCKAKRWQGIEIYAGPEGIAIQCESKGTNLLFNDPSLAGYLSKKIGSGA